MITTLTATFSGIITKMKTVTDTPFPQINIYMETTETTAGCHVIRHKLVFKKSRAKLAENFKEGMAITATGTLREEVLDWDKVLTRFVLSVAEAEEIGSDPEPSDIPF